jgi:hypothetical protein
MFLKFSLVILFSVSLTVLPLRCFETLFSFFCFLSSVHHLSSYLHFPVLCRPAVLFSSSLCSLCMSCFNHFLLCLSSFLPVYSLKFPLYSTFLFTVFNCTSRSQVIYSITVGPFFLSFLSILFSVLSLHVLL